jgi:hypothetical protein
MPTMTIKGFLPTDRATQTPSIGTSLRTIYDENEADFSTLLFLVLAAPQIHGLTTQREPQAGGPADDFIPADLVNVPFSAVGARPVAADPSFSLVDTEVLPSKTDLALDFQPYADAAPVNLPGHQRNGNSWDAIVIFQKQEGAAVAYPGETGEIVKLAAVSQAPGSLTAEKTSLVLKDRPQSTSLSVTQVLQEGTSFETQPIPPATVPISHSERVDSAQIFSGRDGPLTVQDDGEIMFNGTAERDLGTETESNQNHSAEPPDSSSLSYSIAQRSDAVVKAGDARSSAHWTPVIDRIAREIVSSVRDNKLEAFITLEPPELGGIKITISLEGDRVQARISAEAHESGRLIENHVSELKQAFQLQSLDLVDIRVDSGNWGGVRYDHGQGSWQSFERQQGSPDGNGGFFTPGTTDGDGEQRFRLFTSNGRVSVWV